MVHEASPIASYSIHFYTWPMHDIILPYKELGSRDICTGADPYVWREKSLWHLLLQEDVGSGPEAHDGIRGYTIRSAPSIDALLWAKPEPLKVESQESGLHQAWAAEVHFEKYLYVAISNGDNVTHRMRVYETQGNHLGPWVDRGWLQYPHEDDAWAIDLTFSHIAWNGEKKWYAVWSGWDTAEYESLKERISEVVVPQHIYIAEMISPLEIGPRHKIVSPVHAWSSSVAPVLEGPQSLMLKRAFRGILVTGNASWTEKYATNILSYAGGDPLSSDSWHMQPEPLFADGHGIGHGMILEDGEKLFYVGHRKTRRTHGWEDRVVFFAELDRAHLENYLHSYEEIARNERIRSLSA